MEQSNHPIRSWLLENRFIVLLVFLLNFLLTPIYSSIFGISPHLIILINYTLLIFAAMNMALRRRISIFVIIFGVLSISCIWLEYGIAWAQLFSVLRIFFSFLFFVLISYIVIRNFLNRTETTLDTIYGAFSGFVILGIIGGILYEFLYFCDPTAFHLEADSSAYAFYYFSFYLIIG